MKIDRLIENIIEQIKEAQIKLGYVKEVIRLYFPAASLSLLLQIPEEVNFRSDPTGNSF